MGKIQPQEGQWGWSWRTDRQAQRRPLLVGAIVHRMSGLCDHPGNESASPSSPRFGDSLTVLR